MEENNSGITDLPENTHITLTGKTGVGKSASGITILGANRFPSEQSPNSVTTTCQKQSAEVGNRSITVIDTPDFFYSTQGENLSSEMERSITLASPGVHAFLYVLPLTTHFTKQEADYVSLYKHSFGEEVVRYIVVLFTHGDQLGNKDIETVIAENHFLQDFVNECGGRYHVLNNDDPSNRDQVMNLLEKIGRMIVENGYSYYTIEMLQNAKKREEEQQEQVRQEQLREVERETIKHRKHLDMVKEETEERVRKEMELELEKLKTEIQAKKESVERTKEHLEREDRNRGISKTEKWITEALSQLKQKRLAFSFLLIIMGGMHGYITEVGSGKLKAFRQGCLLGVFSMSLGPVPAWTWVFMRGSMSVSTSHRKKIIGIMCGFAASAIARYTLGARIYVGGDHKIAVLQAGIFGVLGAICFSPDF